MPLKNDGSPHVMSSLPAPLEQRLKALERYHILDTPPEQEFDDLTFLAAFICDTPIALITLLDAKRQWFKSKLGLEEDETPIEHSFCTHAIKQHGVFNVTDAQKDTRFARNPYVERNPNIRFYAGAPLLSDDGVALGTICVIDRVPKTLSNQQQEALSALSRQVINQMEQRRIMRQLAQALVDKEEAMKHVKQLQGMLPICAYCQRVRDDKNYWRQVADYFSNHSKMTFSHGICPNCYPKARADMGLPEED
jgi:GAF domain-containing protein